MTDISFLLIIFFLLSAVFVANGGLRLRLPAESAKPTELAPDEVVQIELPSAGAPLVNGAPVSGGLAGALEALFAETPSLVTIIRVDTGVSYDRVIRTLEAVRTAGGSTFSITAAHGPVPVKIEAEAGG